MASSLTAITRSLGQLRLQTSSLSSSNTNLSQLRTKMTKTKRRRLLKKERVGPKPLPYKYIPKDQPIKINPTAEFRSLAEDPEDQRLSYLLPSRREQLANDPPPLRFHFTNLEEEMTPKVRRMFQLSNGSSNEIAKAQRNKAMKLFERREGDTGSTAVQIMALTSRIQQVQNHVNTHRKDYSGKRGLNALYVRRRKLLDYLERKDYDTYKTMVNALGLVR